MKQEYLSILITFATTFWTLRKDGTGLRDSLEGAVVGMLITFSVLSAIQGDETHKYFINFIGLVIGFIGPERLRAAIVGAWESGKLKLVKK